MRVLAISTESSVAAALNMMDGWEVVFATTEQAESYASGATVLIAGGGTESGLALVGMLRDRGLDTPAVVLGDIPPPENAQVLVVIPPFTLDELRTAVEGAVRGDEAVQRAPLQPLPPAAPPRAVPEPIQRPTPVQVREPVRPVERVDVFEPLVTPQPIESQPIEIPVAAAEAPEAVADVTAPVVPAAPVTVGATPDPWGPPPAPPVAPAPVEEPPHRRWGRRKPQREAPVVAPASTETPMVERLRIAELAARELEATIRKLPVLADLSALSAALIGEIVERFKTEVAIVYVPGERGFTAAASHGLTSSESRMVVPADQPLFAKIWSTREPHLIAPLDLARSTVQGIGGARTDAMIAGPVEAEGGLVGIIVIGGPDFEDRDLDRMDDLAREAAPGLAVALAIQRLRDLA